MRPHLMPRVMGTVLALLALVQAGCLPATVEEAPAGVDAPEGMTLVWSDEFDYTGLPDPQRWDYEHGFIRNRESQFYTKARKENARVENGVLVLEARKERYTNPLHQPGAVLDTRTNLPQPEYERTNNAAREHADYTSASLITRGKAQWKYGRIEVRAKLPGGRGIWPAIWMLGSNRGPVKWPECGEIDLLEYVGFDPGVVHGNVHLPARYLPGMTDEDAIKQNMKAMLQVSDAETAFHTYAIDWDAERIKFFVDDREYLTYDNPGTGVPGWPFDQPFWLLLNVAVGGTWGGQKGIDDSIFPQRMEVDYVRVFQKEGA